MKKPTTNETFKSLAKQLYEAEQEARPNVGAEDLEREAVRLGIARAKVDILRLRVAAAERAEREERILEMGARLERLTAKHSEITAQAKEADDEAMRLALELYPADYQSRIGALLLQCPSVNGNRHRADAEQVMGAIDILRAEFKNERAKE